MYVTGQFHYPSYRGDRPRVWFENEGIGYEVARESLPKRREGR
jgi:hypothetical protein